MRTTRNLKLIFDEDMEKKFQAIKELMGFTSDAETVRFCINYFYRSCILKRKSIDDIIGDMLTEEDKKLIEKAKKGEAKSKVVIEEEELKL